MAFIYKHTRLDTDEIFYIGIGKRYSRINSKYSRNKFWHNIINKTKYSIEIILDNLTWKEACDTEKYLIAYYGRRDLGLGTLVNMTDGGDGSKGFKHTEEFKINLSKRMMNHTVSIETRNKISRGHLNKVLSIETKNKIREYRKNKIVSDETKLKLSISVLQFNKNNELINSFKSISKAAKITNISKGHISKVCKNIRKSAGGYIWKYKNEFYGEY